MNAYLATYVGGAVAALAFTPLVMRAATALGIVDKPNARKVHRRPIPRAGGAAIFAAMFVVAVPVILLSRRSLEFSSFGGSSLGGAANFWILLGAAAFVFLVGLADDLFDIRSQYKLLALIGASLVLCAAGMAPQQISLGQGYTVHLGWFSWPLGVLWIVGVTVAINFIDGLDGLAAGISAVTCGTIAVVAALGGQPVVSLLTLALLGSLTGFLFFNFNPAKVFMGDSGSMFLGFMLSTMSLLCAKRTGLAAGCFLPALALGIPILDALVTMLRRGVLERRSLFSAERGHVHHRLLDRGLKHRHAVIVLYAITLGCAGIGIAAFLSADTLSATVLLAALAALLLSFFAIVGSLRLGEIASAIRRNRVIGRSYKASRKAFEEAQLSFRTVQTFEQWWSAVQAALGKLGFMRFSLMLTNRDGSSRQLEWAAPEFNGAGEHAMTVTVPIRHRRTGGPLRAELEGPPDDALEAAGARVTYFARLMEEHSLASLPEAHATAAEVASDRADSDQAGSDRAEALNRDAVVRESLPRRASMLDPNVKIALVHDFLYTYAGAERVLEQILHVYPDADLFALFDFLPPDQREFIKGKNVTSSFLQKMPLARKKHRNYLPLMPLAIEQLDVSAYDVVISSSYVAAKGVITRPDQLHVCYCHSPVRFAWDLQHQYLNESGMNSGVKSLLARAILHYIRNWDARSANGVDVFLTNSDFVARRIEKFYRRRSTTLYPPVDVDAFTLCTEKEDFYVTVSRMVPYKRIDLIVEAFTAMPEKRLIVVGEGPDFDKIKAKAGPNVKLVGHQPFARLKEYMQRARAFVFAAEEDFGIVPVEAQACGTPVIAFGRGGVTESVIPGQTGLFFPEQTIESLMAVVEEFEQMAGSFDPHAIRANAERFSAARFRDEFQKVVEDEFLGFRSTGRLGREGLYLNPNLALQAQAIRDRLGESPERQSAYA